jgi:hypothetical protein
MAMRPRDDVRKKREPTSGTKAKPHGLSGIKSGSGPSAPLGTGPSHSLPFDPPGAEDPEADIATETTVADHDLQRTLAGLSTTRRDTVGPFAVPPGWGLHELSLLDFWTRVFQLRRAKKDGPEALSLALSAYDLESFAHLEWLRERFEKRYGKDPDFKRAMQEAREASGR